MRKNNSDLIKCPVRRTYTAKASRFEARLIDLIAERRGLTRYHKDMRLVKNEVIKLLGILIFDCGLTYDELKNFIKSSIIKKLN